MAELTSGLCLIQWIMFMKSNLSNKAVKIHSTKILQLLQVKVLQQIKIILSKTSPISCYLLPNLQWLAYSNPSPFPTGFLTRQALPFNLSVVMPQDNCPTSLLWLVPDQGTRVICPSSIHLWISVPESPIADTLIVWGSVWYFRAIIGVS